MISRLCLSLGILFLACAGSNSEAATDEEKQRLIQTYAPRVWLAKGEAYLPSSVEWAFPHLRRVKRADGRYWLEAKQKLDSPSDNTLLLFAGNLATAPVYAFWLEKPTETEQKQIQQGKLETASVVDLVYFFYYPYNRGKEVLDTIWGNHVSDWEHITIRLTARVADDGSRSLAPEKVYVGAHDFGGSQLVHPWEKVPKLPPGTGQGGKGPAAATHPVIFSAEGSHGSYLTAGDHVYKSVLNKPILTDLCSKGKAWDTFRNVKAFDYTKRKGLGGTAWPSWMGEDYGSPGSGPDPSDPANGPIFRWGNQKAGCDIPRFVEDLIHADECRLNDGPVGPLGKSVWNPDPANFE